MQGKKQYVEKLFTQFQLSDRVPKGNFYRRLKEVLDLHFLARLTAPYYGSCGQKSIDPVVFFKLMLVGYLENICSDRQLIQHCSMRLDILFFLGYDIDEELPWHSTISRTRALFPDTVFTEAFEHVLRMCVSQGMVAGHTQSIDAAPVKANASMDSVELKVPAEELEEHLRRVRAYSIMDKQPKRKASQNKASEEQQSITASKRSLDEVKSRNKKWAKDQDQRPGAKNKNSKYTSNKTHYSPVDPDARISVKPGKARKLNYSAQMAVDSAHHVITYMEAYHADKKDSQCLQDITTQLQTRLRKQQLIWSNLAADTGYTSGENYAFLEQQGLRSYIPAHGTYKGGPEGFTYHAAGDCWQCTQGEKVTFRKLVTEASGNKKKLYLTKPSQCKDCPLKASCTGKSPERKIMITAYNAEYQRALARVNSKEGKRIKKLRSSTVEPVFGTLTQFLGLRKINTRGIANANKCMLTAAMAYNLKKYLKFTRKKAQNGVGVSTQLLFHLITHLFNILSPNKRLTF